ncbi:hypothetical protein ACJ73_03827 [Blastomyces percursus]|uniref:Uncharacterized protein n=1 Tax=Blastomyces percursus TaxID=1658174 RepID=A0A1J9RAW3_9EURO|nr:hypothetical protein ACJ73_03827 [Blastomyces percursus]
MFVHTHIANYKSLSTGASQDHEEEYKTSTKIIHFKLSFHHGKDIEPINPTAGDGKPPLQSTLNDEVRDLESYSTDEADWYLVRGDVFHDNEKVPFGFIVFFSDPVLKEQLKYLKAHTSHLHPVFSIIDLTDLWHYRTRSVC